MCDNFMCVTISGEGNLCPKLVLKFFVYGCDICMKYYDFISVYMYIEPQLRPEGNRKNSEVVQRTVEQSKHRTLSPIVSTSHGHLRSTSAEKKPPETMPKYGIKWCRILN